MLQVYTGTGKGKTTAAIGISMRAIGAGMRVYIMQFMKGLAYSEQQVLRDFFPRLVLKTTGKPFFIAAEGMLTPEEREKELGRAIVQQTFQISKVGTVAGCRVTSGTIVRDCKIRIIRNNRVIGTYDLGTLRREKDDVKEVRDGYECGMRLTGFNDVKEGDIFEAFQIESVARTF